MRSCRHIMATFDQHSKCMQCHNKGSGSDTCILKTDCKFCSLLTSDQKSHLATPTYIEMILVDHGSVQILGQVKNNKRSEIATTSKKKITRLKEPAKKKLSSDPSCFASSTSEDIQALDVKWSQRSSRLEPCFWQTPSSNLPVDRF